MAALLLFVAIALYLAPLKPGIVALQLTFSPSAFQQVLAAWQADGVQRFRAHFPADFVLLLLYGSYGLLFATRTPLFGQRSAAARKRTAGLLPLAAGFDATENILHLCLTAPDSAPASILYVVAGACSVLKFVLIATFVSTVLTARSQLKKGTSTNV